jgi:hypothetical protein
MRLLRFLPAFLLAFLAAGCAGYRLGNIPDSDMEGVKTVYVPVVQNRTYEPSLQVMTTNAVIRRLESDGTYLSARSRQADAILEVEIIKYERVPLRRGRDNSLVTDEYRGVLTAKATLTNLRTGTRIFTDLEVKGETDFFVGESLQEAERQFLPLAADNLAYHLVNQVAEGW